MHRGVVRGMEVTFDNCNCGRGRFGAGEVGRKVRVGGIAKKSVCDG